MTSTNRHQHDESMNEILDPVWIPMPDGARLAARIVMPTQRDARIPAVLEYLPYRRSDGTLRRDMVRHPYLASHGFAAVRVDMRGSGDSDGVLYGEYLRQEQDDAVAVIAWLAAQPWCNGNVGMFGISWGGFNALQVAARRPPALKAIITVCSTDDRYADDVHYMGGCMLAVDMLAWASVMLAYNSRPPDPAVLGAQWRESWLTRIEETPAYINEWLSHQQRDAFWQHGSVCEDFSQIQCPVYAVGGWADGYTNAVFRLLEGLAVPRKGLVGPWAHKYPEAGKPGPAIGFQAEAVKWWKHWLMGETTDVMDGPMLTSYIQDWMPPASWYAHRSGAWVGDAVWPSPHTIPWQHALTSDPHMVQIGSDVRSGSDAGMWCSYALPGDYPPDQRGEDGRAWCVDLPVTTTPQCILGFPEVTLRLASNHPTAMVAVRLCDVAPDGSSLLVSRGMLNLTHRSGHEHVQPLVPGRFETVTFRLNAAGHLLAPGHRWRIAVSPIYWPHAWPSPHLVTLHLDTRASTITLPVRQEPHPALAPPAFAAVELSPEVGITDVRAEARRRYEVVDQSAGTYAIHDENDHGAFQREDGLTYDHVSADRYFIRESDPLSARTECEHRIRVGRGDWQTCIETWSEIRCDATHFIVSNRIRAYESDTLVLEKEFHERIVRDGI
ncbi:MAG: CocE/NonD family hydrolase [Roseiflexaceae bacterium]